MAHNSIDLVQDDPIAVKLRDGEAVERLVRQAIAEAVEKARKLGFLDADSEEVTPPASH